MRIRLGILVSIISTLITHGVLAQKAGDFALIDSNGQFQHMSWYNDHKVVVLMSVSTEVSLSAEFQDLLNTANKSSSLNSIKFFLINPGVTEDRDLVNTKFSQFGIPILMDDTQLVSKSLGLETFEEAVIYNPNTFEIEYRGAANTGLLNVIANVQAGNSVQQPELASNHARIAYALPGYDAESSISYSRDIAPIILEKCAECHREGSIAPFSLDSILAVKGWSPMIREVVMTRRMPPGQIDNKVGKRFSSETNLTDEQMRTLIAWIDSGSPVDGDFDPLVDAEWPESEWVLGEPDLVVSIEPQTIPATGVLELKTYPIELNLERDVWLKGSQIVPGDKAVVHHAFASILPPAGGPTPAELAEGILKKMDNVDSERADKVRAKLASMQANGEEIDRVAAIRALGEDVNTGMLFTGNLDGNSAVLAGYAAGYQPSMNPPGVGGILRKGDNIGIEIHYTTSGKETVDETKIGLYFYPDDEVPSIRNTRVFSSTLAIEIPPYTKDHELDTQLTILEDVYLKHITTHMHYRGSRMKYVLEHPNGDKELLLSIPKYSFNWQMLNVLEEPLLIEKGSVIHTIGAFDNSIQNPSNPDPSKTVYFGQQSWDEMFAGIFEWQEVQQQ